MRLIDGSHLKKWILQRWEKAYPNEDLPTREVLEQIDREISYKMIDIDPQSKWIPCSERLPKYGQVVLWCNEYGSVFTSAITEYIGYSWYIGRKHWGARVVAWMPLPEPWKGEEE